MAPKRQKHPRIYQLCRGGWMDEWEDEQVNGE